MAPVLNVSDDQARGYRALSGSPGWFARLKDTLIRDAMCVDDDSGDLMKGVLIGAWTAAPDDVVALLLEQWMPDSRYDLRIWDVLQAAPQWTETILEMACKIVERSEISPFQIENVVALCRSQRTANGPSVGPHTARSRAGVCTGAEQEHCPTAEANVRER